MKYTTAQGEKSTVKITITLTAKEWADMQDKAYEKTKGKYQIPGFRKGHVPKAIIEQHYGKGAFYEDGINEAFGKYYYDILEKEPAIEPIDRPDVSIDKLSEKGLTMIAVVPVKPDVKLGDYKGIKIKKVEYNVTDADVQTELDRFLDQNSFEEEVTGRPAENGDITVIDYSGSVDGVKFDGGTAENQTLTLGSGAFIPGFEDQLVGSRPGDEVRVHVTFPAQYHAPELAGKDAEFVCKVHEIRESGEYGSQDEFAKAVGCGSYEDLRAQVRENLRRYYDQRAEMELQDKLMRQAAATLDYTPSEAELHEAVEQQIQTMEAQLAQRGLRLEDYCKFAGATPESLREDARADAEQALRMQKAVDRIAILEGLRASQKDLDDAMQVIARENGLSLDQLKGYCDDNFNRAVENSVLSTKAYALVRALADVTEITVGGQK